MSDDLLNELRATAERLGGAEAAAEVDALIKRVDRYSNLPGVVKGLGKLDFSRHVEDAALQIVRDQIVRDVNVRNENGESSDAQRLRAAAGLFETWTLITLAARSDVTVLDEVEASLEGGYVAQRIREVRRGTDKAIVRREAAASPAAPASAPSAAAGAVEPPQSVGKVKAWLSANADADFAILAPQAKQKAGAKAAAIRALGQIATPQAFEVLKAYATDEPSDAVLTELLRAWSSFDRREYAAAMFRPQNGYLDLGVVTDITGIDAVPALTALRIVVDDKKDDKTDLAPLALCTGLRALQVQFNGPGLPSQIEWLRPLTELRALDLGVVLRNTDLSPLAASGIEKLTICLDGQDGSILLDIPQLDRLTVIAASSEHSDVPQTAAHPALSEHVLTLVRRGVPVTVYDFDGPWSSDLVSRAQADGLEVITGHGVRTIHRGDGTGPTGSPTPDRFLV